MSCKGFNSTRSNYITSFYYEDRLDTSFNYKCTNFMNGYSCNPYTYFNFGLLLLDEVISEFVSNMVCAQIRGEDMKTYSFERYIGSRLLKYYSHFSYYGIGEKFVEMFSKTLFLPNSEKNIKGLAKKILNSDFNSLLVLEHFENDSAIKGLYEELCYMGVIAFNEEKCNGHLKDRYDIPSDLVTYSYNKCRDSLINGEENREVIPYGIVKPYFLK